MRKDREPGQEKQSNFFNKKFSRRRFLALSTTSTMITAIYGLKTGAIAKGLSERILDGQLDALINQQVPIPTDLQQPTEIEQGQEVLILGLGNSNMVGVGSGNIPLPTLIGEAAESQGIKMSTICAAVSNTLTTDLPRQAEQAKEKLSQIRDTNNMNILDVWTGENDIRNDHVLVDALKQLAKNPFDATAWMQYNERRNTLRAELRKSLYENIQSAASTLGVDTITLYGLSPVQFAKNIIAVDPATGQTTFFPVVAQSSPLVTKINQAILADLVREGTKAVIDTAYALKQQEYNVTVINSADCVHPSDFTPETHEHFDKQAAERLAKRRVKKIKVIRQIAESLSSFRTRRIFP